MIKESPLFRIFIKFQFHKGTIRIGQLNGNIRRSNSFQFHKGTIRIH